MPGGRPEGPLEAADSPLAAFAVGLRELRARSGNPTYREMSARSGLPVASLARAAGGRVLPGVRLVKAYVLACQGDEREWVARWRALATAEHARRRGRRPRTSPPVHPPFISGGDSSVPEGRFKTATGSAGPRWSAMATNGALG